MDKNTRFQHFLTNIIIKEAEKREEKNKKKTEKIKRPYISAL